MAKRLPLFKSDEDAAAFLEQELTDYISPETLVPFPFELRPKQKSLNLRISEGLLDAVRARAAEQGVPYQRYIRQALEVAVNRDARTAAPAKRKRAGR